MVVAPPVVKSDPTPHKPVSLTTPRVANAGEGVATPPVETIVLERANTTPDVPTSQSVSWLAIGLLLWAAGVAAFMIRLFLSRQALRRITSTASASVDPAWISLVERVRHELGISRAVSIRMSDAVTVPAVTGLRHPILLLPVESSEWTESERRQVALHEMAHVVRWDGLSQLVTQLACAVYWFVPLVWYGARRAAELRHRLEDQRTRHHG